MPVFCQWPRHEQDPSTGTSWKWVFYNIVNKLTFSVFIICILVMFCTRRCINVGFSCCVTLCGTKWQVTLKVKLVFLTVTNSVKLAPGPYRMATECCNIIVQITTRSYTLQVHDSMLLASQSSEKCLCVKMCSQWKTPAYFLCER